MRILDKYSEYKDCGVEWLGEVPKHWELKRLKNIASHINRGVTPKYVEYSEFRVINQATFSKGFFDFEAAKFTKHNSFENDGLIKGIVRRNDILLASTGGGVLGKVAHYELDDDNYLADSHVTIIRGGEEFASKFFYYILSINYDLINGILAQGSTNQTELQRDWLRNLKFPIPPFPEQIRITQFLDHKAAQIDKAIAIKEKQIVLLKERRQLLILQAVTRGLDKEVEMKDSGVEDLGSIPRHWKMIRLKYLLTERTERSETGAETLLMVSQTHGLVVRANFHDKAEVAQSTIGNKKVYYGDLVFNKLKAHLGVFFKSEINKIGLVSPDYAVYVSNGGITNLKYLEFLFRHPSYIKQFICKATGIVQGLIRLYTSDLFELKIPVPPDTEQKGILIKIDEFEQKFSKAVSLKLDEIEKLKEYKATLINSAVTGKIRV